MKQREYRILELLTERKRIEVAALAREIGVSQVTVRKDLDALEEKGVIHREHGWAVLCSPDDLNGRIAYHYEAKRRIAARAAELVRDGETVMIESGSCWRAAGGHTGGRGPGCDDHHQQRVHRRVRAGEAGREGDLAGRRLPERRPSDGGGR